MDRQPKPVNFVHDQKSPAETPKRRRHFGLLGLLLVLAVVVVSVAYVASTSSTIAKITNQSLIQQLGHLVSNRDKELMGEDQDRVNILLLGIGGAGHEGAYLTDTLILASLKPSTKQVSLLSIPRDLAVEIPGHGIRKINAANALAVQSDTPGDSERVTASIVQEVTGQTVHYFARIDFAGFRDLINQVGGVQVNVDTAFTDGEYPDYNFGYQTVRFEAGAQSLNGERALQFVRSRHGNNGEGSDFARGRRQQKVLSALKDKLFSLSLLASPSRLADALETFGNHARTDMEIWEMARAASLVRGNDVPIQSLVLDSTPEGLLKNTTGIDGAFLLVPRAGDWSEIHTFAANIFGLDQLKAESPVIAVSGSSRVANSARDTIAGLGVFNATTVTLPQNLNPGSTPLAIDLSGGRKPLTAAALQSSYTLTPVASVEALASLYPSFTTEVISRLTDTPVDFVLLAAPRSSTTAKSAGSPSL